MIGESSFVRKREPDEVLKALFKQRKKWFIDSLSAAVESVTSDQLVYQMFQVPSSQLYIPDRICEIVIHSLSDDKEEYIKQLLYFLSENSNYVDFNELERVGSQLLNLSSKQIQIEIDQRNKIKELNSSSIIENQRLQILLHKLTILNTLVLAIAQEMRAFKRRIPLLLGKYQNLLKSHITDYVSKTKITVDDLKFQNKRLKSENSKLVEFNQNVSTSHTEEVTILKNSLTKYQVKYNKLKSAKSQSDIMSEKYQKQLKTTQDELVSIQKVNNSMQTELSKIKEKSDINDSIQFQQTNELNIMKKQIQEYKEKIRQDQQRISQLESKIQSHEEMTSKKFQNLIISQKIIKKLKDEFEKVSFVLHELRNIDINEDSNNGNSNEEIIDRIRMIKSKIESKNFESEMLSGLKEKCEELMLTKSKIKQNFSDELSASNFRELSFLIEICTNLTVQDELHQILSQLNEKFEISKINSGSNETITKLFRQLNRKTKENQRLSIINQKLQSQKDDLQQQLGDIKMQLRSNPSLSPLLPTSSRMIFSPSKSTNDITVSTPKVTSKSEIGNQTFDDSASPIFNMNQRQNFTLSPQRFPLNNFSENDEGDDEGENELIDNEIFNKNNNFTDIKNILNPNKARIKSNENYDQNEEFTLIQTLSALFDMNDADEIPNRISGLVEKSEEYDHFQAALCSSLNIDHNDQKNESKANSNYNEIMVHIEKLKFENKKMKSREEKIKMLLNNQVPSSQIPNEIAKIIKNMKYIQKLLSKGSFDSCQELFENYYSMKKLNKAFIEREDMFRNCFSKYEFDKMPQLLSSLIKENKKFHSIEKELEKVESSVSIFQIPKFILQIRANFAKFMETFCRIIFNNLRIRLSELKLKNSDNLISDFEDNTELINDIAKIEEMKLLLPLDDAIDIGGFVNCIL